MLYNHFDRWLCSTCKQGPFATCPCEFTAKADITELGGYAAFFVGHEHLDDELAALRRDIDINTMHDSPIMYVFDYDTHQPPASFFDDFETDD